MICVRSRKDFGFNKKYLVSSGTSIRATVNLPCLARNVRSELQSLAPQAKALLYSKKYLLKNMSIKRILVPGEFFIYLFIYLKHQTRS